VVKKADRVAKAAQRAARREQYEREEIAMQSFLEQCRSCMSPVDWAKHSEEAARYAGETFHIVEHFVRALATTQVPIPPQLRQSLDAMLESLSIDRKDSNWDDLRRLNYGQYWKAQYGYE
jgi:hypothetical protein